MILGGAPLSSANTQHSQQTGDVVSGGGIVAVLFEPGFEFGQQVSLLARVEILLGEGAAEPHQVSERHRRFVGQRRGQRRLLGR
jgi:hypothetical protein